MTSSKNIPPELHEHYSVAIANHENNIRSNRYMDVVPYDRTRVIVGHCVDDGESGRYLNANWVLERYGHKWWIAAQAPLPTTAHAFLSVILQPNSTPPVAPLLLSSDQEATGSATPSNNTIRIRTVVQLTRNVESGRVKAHPYFPSEVGRSLVISPEPGSSDPALKITLLQIHGHEDAQCIRSTVGIMPINTASQRDVTMPPKSRGDGGVESNDQQIIFQHLLYTAWPDHGVPEKEDRGSLLAFLKLVDQINRDTSLCFYPAGPHSEAQKQLHLDPPIMVGCSAGIGRTGSFIALSSLLRHSGVLPPAVDPTPTSIIPPSPLGLLPDELMEDLVAGEIDSLREQRPRMVERPEQTLLIYELLTDAVNKDWVEA